MNVEDDLRHFKALFHDHLSLCMGIVGRVSYLEDKFKALQTQQENDKQELKQQLEEMEWRLTKK